MVLICLKLNPFHPRELWMKLAKWFWSKRLLNSVLSSLRNLESSPYPRMFEPSLIEIDPLHLKNLVNLVIIIVCYWNFIHLNKHESPSPKNDLCQVWLEFAQCFWRRSFYLDTCVYGLSQFCLYLPLKKSVAVHFNRLGFPLFDLRATCVLSDLRTILCCLRKLCHATY